MQQFSNTQRVVVTAVIASMGLPALAEPPMQVDDAGTLGKGGMKIEGVLAREDKVRGAELGFGYGPIENVEIGLAFARETDRADQPSTKIRGLGMVIKWIPIQNDTGWSLGMRLGYDRARAHIRSAIPPDPERETEKAYSLAGLASYRFESGRVLHVNLGSTRVKVGGETDTVAGWGIGFEQPLMAKLIDAKHLLLKCGLSPPLSWHGKTRHENAVVRSARRAAAASGRSASAGLDV